MNYICSLNRSFIPPLFFRLGSLPYLWQSVRLVCTYATVSVVEASVSIVLMFILCHIQALDMLDMLKKEEEMLSAVKDRQSKVVQCLVCQILHEALLCVSSQSAVGLLLLFYIDNIITLEIFITL